MTITTIVANKILHFVLHFKYVRFLEEIRF